MTALSEPPRNKMPTPNSIHVAAIKEMLPSGLERRRRRHESPPDEVYETAGKYTLLHPELPPALIVTLACRAYWGPSKE